MFFNMFGSRQRTVNLWKIYYREHSILVVDKNTWLKVHHKWYMRYVHASTIRHKLCVVKHKGQRSRSSHLEVFLRKAVLKMCSKFTGEYSCRSLISIKLRCNFIEIALRHGCSPVNLLYIFRKPFPRNTSGWLYL